MKKKIAILGSTGSIGKNLLKIISKEKKKFEIVLLTANKNYFGLLKQAKKYKVKNLIIKDSKSFNILKNKISKSKIHLYNDYDSFDKIFKNKIDYVMSSISGIEGLTPTINIIKFTKNIAIANKESIICAWNLISNELKKNKTQFVPVDSEHFSLWYALKSSSKLNVEKIFLTASGGPLLNFPKSKIKNISVSQALNHPTWSMGKKISIDSCTMMNKVFEVIEARHIFNIDYKRISILTHPNSYIHALVKFNNGIIKIIAHDTTMKIPIFNTINLEENMSIKTNKINIEKLNHLNLNKINKKNFPFIQILKNLPNRITLYETVLVSANDYLVEMFLKNKIKFNNMQKFLLKFIKSKDLIKFKEKKPKKIQDIILVKNIVSSKIAKSLTN